MAIVDLIRAPRGAAPAAPSWDTGIRDHVPTVSSRLMSHWSPDPDGRQVWRWSITDAPHP